MKRVVYFVYYVAKTDRTLFCSFLKYASSVSGRSWISIVWDVVTSSFRYKMSLLDYFYFRFFALDRSAREMYAGTGFMYEYQLRMNPPGSREVLEDKYLFLDKFAPFVRRKFANLDMLMGDGSLAASFLNSKSGRIVLKGTKGQAGNEVRILQCQDFVPDTLIEFMQRSQLHLIEEFVVQHSDLMGLSPSGLNTVRVFTQYYNDQMVLLGARLRITINSAVDNMAAGNVAAPIDLKSGEVIGPGVFSDIRKTDLAVHPITGVSILGFRIPFWKETLDMLAQAVRVVPENRSIGWDIAITPSGPELIEGNHNWCKLLWQLPVRKGLKKELERFM